jgi:hypothetical protein
MYRKWTETDCHMWETKTKKTPQKTSRLLMGPEQVTRPKIYQLYYYYYEDDLLRLSANHMAIFRGIKYKVTYIKYIR